MIESGVLATNWFPFRCLIELDRAIAALAGGDVSQAMRSLGRHSGAQNLTGTYRAFVADDPHRLFERTALLHSQFQNFGQSAGETGSLTGPLTSSIFDGASRKLKLRTSMPPERPSP